MTSYLASHESFKMLWKSYSHTAKENDMLTKHINAPNVISAVSGLWKWVYVQIRSMCLGKSFC
jgi:hypothetical protein